jgi:AcrR family transcriptional regulator
VPAKATITRQQVIDAALALLRREGAEALSARAVARELGCSTQPIYSAFGSMDELAEELRGRAEEVARRYLAPTPSSRSALSGGRTRSPAPDDPPPFLAVGLGSLRLARDEPQLYRLLARTGAFLRELAHGKPPPGFVLARMKADPALAGLSYTQLARIHALMWFFSQGLATLFVSDVGGDPMAIAEEYLELAGRAVIEAERRRAGLRRPAARKLARNRNRRRES